jgi:hypothetical protein
MAPNKHQPHILILPEDEADRELANGFRLGLSLFERKLQVLAEAGGWARVIDQFEDDQIVGLEKWPTRFMVLLVDFDGNVNRLLQIKSRIPENLQDRVFVLGSLTDPEELKAQLGESLENIGKALAKDCREDSNATWGHALLRHNANELNRMRDNVRPILFPTN